MTALALGLVAGLGAFYVYTAAFCGWRTWRPAPNRNTTKREGKKLFDFNMWLAQAGLSGINKREFLGVVAVFGIVGGLVTFAAFGGLLPSLLVGAFAASSPFALYRLRRRRRRQLAQEAWPRMIEEIRLQTSSLGRSIPQALFAVGRRGPEELQACFNAAHREWLLTTDWNRTISVLKHHLADPTADMACETLLCAHELGGVDLDERLRALAEDRLLDVQGRKEADSRQAGARFARLFVFFVPAGMTLAGISIGNGRAAYQTSLAQVLVLVALVMIIGCWVWAGRVMRLPEAQRVFKD